MRSKEEITKEFSQYSKGCYEPDQLSLYLNTIQLEVLLDIRELLHTTEIKEKEEG